MNRDYSEESFTPIPPPTPPLKGGANIATAASHPPLQGEGWGEDGLKNIPAALLKIAGLNLVLPQSEIRAVEAASEVDTTDPELHSTGWINYAQQRWPVYCFSEELTLLAQAPAQRRTCALVAIDNGYMGILCDDVSIMRQMPSRRYELPDAMRLPGTPVLHLLALDESIACLSDARQLAAHVRRLAAQS